MKVSDENRIFSNKIMGVETSIPPIMIYAAAPGGAPRGGSTTDISEKHTNCPGRAPEGP
jgi:hypothetical protein